METDIDEYLKSDAALNQTESAQGCLLHPGETFGVFRIIAFLGRGATGEVWRVHDESLNADFAMKIFAPREAVAERESARLRRRFIAEARCLAQFTHPGIVRVHVLQNVGEHPFYTMDLLHPIVRPLARRKARKIIGAVLSALSTLHAKGIVHRDIKPANVLLDDNGNALLTDFGIAQIDDAETAEKITPPQTTTTTASIGSARIAGTPDFSAPEQFIGADASPASDLHAVGRLAVWLFGGKPPFAWRGFVLRATNSSAALRYRSAKDMRRSLGCVRLLEMLPWAVGGFAACALVFFAASLAVPTPVEVADDDISEEVREYRYDCLDHPIRRNTTVITLKDGREYVMKDLYGGPCPVVEKENPSAGPRRAGDFVKLAKPLVVQGNGTLRVPEISFYQVHLMPGVKLVTSGEYRNPAYGGVSVRPPPEASPTNLVVYASYFVADGAEVVFTDNPDYPKSLIVRE